MFDPIEYQYDIPEEEPVNFAFDPDHPNRKRSCAGRLAQLRRQFGITDDDLKTFTKPTEVQLPIFHENTKSPELKERRAQEKKAIKSRKYEIASWYLEEYLCEKNRQRLLWKCDNITTKEFVEVIYREAMITLEHIAYTNTPILDPMDVAEEIWSETHQEVVCEFDLLEEEDEDFDRYCKKHPIKDASEIIDRRMSYKKYRKKKRKKYYSMKRMRMYDPLFKSEYIDTKTMAKNLKRISEENELRIKKFNEMMKKLVDDNAVGIEAMEKFKEQTDAMLKRTRKRYNRLLKENEMKFPSSVQFDVNDNGHESSILYDDWDSKKAIDSILRIPCSDI